MRKPYNPADYNLVANPTLPKTNSVLPILGAMIVCAVVIAVAWEFFTPEIRLTRPILAFTSEKITATTKVTNRTDAPATVEIRISLGAEVGSSSYKVGEFFPATRQDVWVTIPPHSTAPVVCTFSPQSGVAGNRAEARILQQR